MSESSDRALREQADCALREQIECALAYGSFREAVEAALQLAALRPDDPGSIIGLLDRIGRAAGHCRGILPPTHPGKQRILELYTREFLCPPGRVESLWQQVVPGPDSSRHTIFPVADVGTSRGGVRELRVVRAGRPRFGDPIEVVNDPDFQRAIAQARDYCSRRLDGRRLLADTQVEILPRGIANASLRGGSVGLAALVAFAAWVLDCELPIQYAFSGCIAGDELIPVAPDTIAGKLRGLAGRAQIQTLIAVVPEGTTSIPDEVVPTLERATDAWDILGRVLGWEHLRARPRQAAQPGPLQQAIRVHSEAHDELRLRLLAVLLAATEPRAVEQLEAGLLLIEPTQQLTGFSVGRELRRWLAAQEDWPSVEVDSIGRFYLPEDVRPSYVTDVAGARLSAAHQALARMLSASPAAGPHELALAAWHSHSAGRAEERRLHVHRLGALVEGGTLEEAEGLVTLLEGAGANGLALVCGDLRASQDVEAQLLELALLARVMPSPVAQLAERLLTRCLPDRILAVQAVAEVTLYLMNAIHLADQGDFGRLPSIKGAEKFSERPSVGPLVELADVLQRAEPSRSVARRLHAIYGTGLRGVLTTLTMKANAALHGLGAWSWLYDLDERGQATQRGDHTDVLEALVEQTRAFVEALVPLFREYPLEVRDARGILPPTPLMGADATARLEQPRYGISTPEGWLDLGGLCAALKPEEDAAVVGFYRGVVNGVLRYWGFDEPLDRRVQVPASIEPGRVLSSPWLSEAPRLGEVVHFIPAVVAQEAAACARDPKRHPLPLARALDGLACRADTVGSRLASLDLAVSTLLRLMVFPSLVASHGRRDDREGLWEKRGPLAERLTKWRLVKLLSTPVAQTAETRPSLSALLRQVTDDPEPLWDLVDVVQRFEHVPGPMGANEEAVQKAVDRLNGLLALAPWYVTRQEERFLLVGRIEDGGLVDLMGMAPTPLAVDPEDQFLTSLLKTLPSGEIAFLHTSDNPPILLPFGPLARLWAAAAPGLPGDVWLLAEHRRGTLLHYTIDVKGKFANERVPAGRVATAS